MFQFLRRRRVARRGLFCRLRGDRGSSVVEFALVMPILATLVMGIIDFGATFDTWSAVRQGVWNGARSGAVAIFGSSSNCNLTFTGGGSAPSADMEDLMCLTKAEIGLPTSSIRTDVILSDPTLSVTGTAWTVTGGLTVCAQVPANSVTGFFGFVFSGHYLRAKTTLRIEQASASPESQGYETDPSGSNWSWCTPAGSAP